VGDPAGVPAARKNAAGNPAAAWVAAGVVTNRRVWGREKCF